MFNSCNNSAPVEYQVNYGAHDIDSPIAIENSGGDFTASVLYGSIGMANSISCLPQFIDISHARKHQGVPHVAESIALEQLAGEAMFQQNYNCNNNYTYTSRPKLQGEYDDASECRRRASAPALFAFNPLMSSPPLVGSSDAKTSLLSSSCSSSSMNSSSSSLALSSSGLSSTAATSSPPAPGAAQFLLTQQNYAYVPTDQQQHHSQQQPFPHHPIDHLHLQQQQQQYQQQQHQHQHTGFASSCPHDPTPSHTPLSANGFQGVACSDSSNPHQSNALAPSPCHSWNDRFASPTGPFPMNSIPAPIAWANSTPSTSLDMLYLHQQQQQQQQLQQQQEHRHLLPYDPHSFVPKESQRRPKLRKAHQQHLHISTSPTTHPLIVPNASRDDPSGMHTLFSPSYTATAGMMHPQSFTWGVVSPVESCLPSGASTPSFASQSPCLSFSATDINSNGSSRATSPLLTHQQQQQQQHHHHHHHHHQSHSMISNDRHATEGRPSSDPYPTKLAHSRKSSTSSIQSNTASRQRRASIARDSAAASSSPSGPPTTASATNVSSSTTHRCPTCSQCFAGPAVLVRHVESIHKKLLWCCIGCKSNLSRRDAVTRHINLSPMESICRTVGRIGQIKTLNGTEVHCEISSYRAKPLDEVMSRMGKKISTELKKEIDRAKGMNGLSEEMLDRLVETEEGCDEDEEEEEEEEQVEEDSKADIKLEDFDEGPLNKRRWP